MPTSPLVHPDGTWDSRIADFRGVGAYGEVLEDRPATIFLPPGNTTIEQLPIKDGDVVKGAGEGVTRLLLTKSLADLFGVSPAHSYNGGLLQGKSCGGITIEDMTIVAPVTPVLKHHEERGWNAISLQGINNAMVRRITFENVDSGVLVEWGCSRVTTQDLTFRSARTPRNTATDGTGEPYGLYTNHHGVEWEGSHDCLAQRLTFETQDLHSISFDNAERIVVSGVRAKRFYCDHHKCPEGNRRLLIEDVICDNINSTFWMSGGKPTYAAHGGPGSVYYNIRRPDGTPLTLPPPWPSPGLVMESRLDVKPVSLYFFQMGLEPYPPTTPEEPPMANKFVVGDRVQATSQINVRPAPGIGSIPPVLLPAGDFGTILAGPFDAPADNYIWWKVQFDGSLTGYCGEDKLTKIVPPVVDARARAEAKLIGLGLTAEEARAL